MSLPGDLAGRLTEGGSLQPTGEGSAYTTPDPVDARRGPRPQLILAVLLMVSLHVFWMIWLGQAPRRPRGATVPPSRIVYAPHHQRGGANALWSPVLLSLPSPSGFSGWTGAERIDTGPTLSHPPAPDRFLNRSSYAPGAVPSPPAQSALRPGASWFALETLRREADANPEAGAAASPLALAIEDGLTREALEFIELPGDLERVGETTWTAVAWVEFDAAGLADHVFLEQASGDAVRDRDLLRSLYQWRVKIDQGHRAGRVSFRYFRAPAGDEGDAL